MTITESHEASRSETKARTVKFRARDVHVPDPSALLLQLFGDQLLEGQVVDQSIGSTADESFLAVQVNGAKTPVVINATRVLRAANS